MSLQFLKDALEDVKALIAITEQDITDIKVANNDTIFARVSQKEELIASFIKKKEAYAQGIEAKLREYYTNAAMIILKSLKGLTLILERCLWRFASFIIRFLKILFQ